MSKLEHVLHAPVLDTVKGQGGKYTIEYTAVVALIYIECSLVTKFHFHFWRSRSTRIASRNGMRETSLNSPHVGIQH
jgi:hypothetical protein